MGRNWSISLFRVFGIQLELHLTFLLLLVYVGWVGAHTDGAYGAAWWILLIICGFACVVMHELGHSLVARNFGIGTHRILLLPIGGIAQLTSIPREPWRELYITLAGPAVNFFLAGLLTALLYLGQASFSMQSIELEIYRLSTAGFIWSLLQYNLVMGLFNCLPIFPMDGGRILRSILAMRMPYLKATKIAAWIGKPLSAGLVLVSAYFHLWMPAILFLFIFIAGEMEWQLVRRRERYSNLPVGAITARKFSRYPRELTVGHAAEILLVDQPQEIVVTDKEIVLAIFSPEEIEAFARNHPPGLELIKLGSTPQKFQSDWPISMLGKYLESRDPRAYPVYDHGNLLGILRLKHIDELLERHRIRLRTHFGNTRAPWPTSPPDSNNITK